MQTNKNCIKFIVQLTKKHQYFQRPNPDTYRTNINEPFLNSVECSIQSFNSFSVTSDEPILNLYVRHVRYFVAKFKSMKV